MWKSMNHDDEDDNVDGDDNGDEEEMEEMARKRLLQGVLCALNTESQSTEVAKTMY